MYILDELCKKGNEKACSIVKYLKSFSSVTLFEEKRQFFLQNAVHTQLFQTNYGGIDLKWSELVIDAVNEKKVVKFSCEALFHSECRIRVLREILTLRAESPLRTRFLQKVVDASLKKKGYKLKRFNDTQGHYYVTMSVVVGSRIFAHTPDKDNNWQNKNTASEVSGTYVYEIVPI
jgi:hypothetical protein